MKKSTVVTVFVVIAALIAVYAIQQINKSRQKLTPAEDFVKILPQDMRAADIHRLEIYRGDAKDDAILLARSEDGWNVPSRFSSKGNEKSISDLLDDIKKLTGELRTKKKSLHKDFDITDQKAVHIALYKKGDELYRELLLGKKGERWGEGFVRLADRNEVYLADKNLLSTLGIYSEGDKADAKKWLDLGIMDEESEKIAKVVLDMPGKQVVLEKKEKKKPEEEEKPDEGEETTPPEEIKEETKEYEWVLAKPEIEFKLKESTVQSLVKSLSQVKGEDVADPAKMDEYGLDSPVYTAAVTLEDDSTETLLVGKKTEEDSKRYAKLKDGSTVYIVPNNTVTGVFKKMRELVDIKIWDLNKDDVASIALHKPEYEILLERQPKEGTEGKEPKDLEWVLAKPSAAAAFKLKDFRITSILGRVTKPSPDDLFVTGELSSYGLDSPEFKAVVKMKDDSAHALLFGKNLEDSEDRYVKFEGIDHVYSFTKYNFQDLFPTLPKLLTIEIMKDLKEDEIVSLKYDTADEDFVLSRKEAEEKKWTVKAGDEESDASSNMIEGILDAVTGIVPEDMLVGKTDADCGLDEPSETLTISTKEAADRYTILFGKEVSEETTPSAWYFKMKGSPEIFILSKASFEEIFRKLETLKVKKPPKPKDEEEKPPAEEEAAPSVEKPLTPPVPEKPTAPEEKLTPPEEKPKEVPEKKEEKPESAAPEEEPALEKEKAEPAVPAPEAPPTPQPGDEKEKEKGPSSPEEDKPAPKPPANRPSLPNAKEKLIPPPFPELPTPKKPVPLPATPQKD